MRWQSVSSVEAEHLAVRLGKGAAFRIEQRAAAEGDDVSRPRAHVGERLLLAGAEPRLPFLREDLRDRPAVRLDDDGVKVRERQAEPRGEQAADGRLAAAGRPVEEQVAHGRRQASALFVFWASFTRIGRPMTSLSFISAMAFSASGRFGITTKANPLDLLL